MHGRLHLVLVVCLFSYLGKSQKDPKVTEMWKPVPAKVSTGIIGTPPSDAIVLFDGDDLSNFEHSDGSEVKWNLSDGNVTVNPKSSGIRTKQKFGDCQLHIEWRSPESDHDEGQGKGNSGVYFMERYEVQILDSYKNITYSNGQASSVYKQYIPLVNASKAPGEWQSYDIIFMAPKFGDSGRVVSPARITILHNGVLVQNNVSLLGATKYIGLPNYKEHGNEEPIMLQNHGDLVSFRNIWIRKL